MVRVARVGSSLATECFEAPKTYENPWWVGLGWERQVLLLFLASRQEDPKFFTGLGCQLLQTLSLTPANRNTCILVLFPTSWTLLPQGSDPTGPVMQKDLGWNPIPSPSPPPASPLTSLCLRLYICETGTTNPTSCAGCLEDSKRSVSLLFFPLLPAPRAHSGASEGKRRRLNMLGFHWPH